jgi:hypothetical protein
VVQLVLLVHKVQGVAGLSGATGSAGAQGIQGVLDCAEQLEHQGVAWRSSAQGKGYWSTGARALCTSDYLVQLAQVVNREAEICKYNYNELVALMLMFWKK